MVELETLKTKLKEMLSLARYHHSLSTSRVASQLATRYDLNPMKALVAGLLHDCAKALTPGQQRDYIERNNIHLDEVEFKEPGLWHGPIGEVMAKEAFGIEDHDILKAIRIHSIGSSQMSLVTKIVYVADYVEPYRSFKGRGEIARLALKNLDLAALYVLNHKLTHLLHKRTLIHPNSIKARNMLLRRILG